MIPFEYEHEREKLYWLNTSYACGGLIVKNNLITDAAPIYKWMKGKTVGYVINYLKKKGSFRNCHEV